MSLVWLFSREADFTALYARNIVKGGKADCSEFISGMRDWRHLYGWMDRLGI